MIPPESFASTPPLGPSPSPQPKHTSGLSVGFRPLPKAALRLFRFKALIALGVLVLSASVILILTATIETFDVGLPFDQLASLFGVLVAGALVWLQTWPRISWKRRQWRLTETVLEYHSGVIFQVELTLPRSRVQHTEVAQGPLQRRFDVATLTIYTAGEHFADIAVVGLEAELARSLRDKLLNHQPDHVV